MKYPYSYNIAPEFDTDAFWRVVNKLDAVLTGITNQQLIEDFLDGSLLKIYHVGDRVIRAECDWDIGAVFVDSEINLDAIFGDKKNENR